MRIMIFSEVVTLAHFLRPLALAKKLKENGHEIFFVTSNSQYALADQLDGLEHVFLESPVTPEVFKNAIESGGHPYTEEILSNYLKEEVKLISSFLPDLLIGDMRLSLHVTAHVLKLPFVNISNSFWDRSAQVSSHFQPFFLPFMPTFKLRNNQVTRVVFFLLKQIIFNRLAQSFNRFAKKNGATAYGNYNDVLTKGTYTLYCDCEGLVKLSHKDPKKRVIGALLYETESPLPQELKIRSLKKRIFLSMGSSGPQELLGEMLEVLKNFNVEVLVSSTREIKKKDLGPNIRIYKFLPYSKVTNYVDLVICNGGTPGVYSALSNGVPVLMIPLNFDQLIFSHLMTQFSVGSIIRSDEFSKNRFSKEIKKILSSDGLNQAAKEFKNKLNSTDPMENFISQINLIKDEITK